MKTLILILAIASLIAVFSPVGETVEDKSLVLHLSFAANSGDKAKDFSGNGNDGTLFGGAKWTTGKYGGGVYLDGKDDYIEVPNLIGDEGTIEFWFKPDWDGADKEDYRLFDASLGGIYFFISKGADHADITPADFGFYFEDASDADWQDVEFPAAGAITAGKWFHVAATWEFNGGFPFLYIDGEEAAKSANAIGGKPALFPNPRFGLESIKYVASKNGAKGIIDEIAISNKQKTAKEIQHDMTALSLAVEPNSKLTTAWGSLKVRH